MADFSVRAAIRAVDRISQPVRRAAAAVRHKLGGAFKATSRAAAMAGKSIATAGKALAKYAAFPVAAATAGVLKMSDAHARAADNMSKLARRSGITVKAYQELRHAADLSGVSQRQFDSALVKFTRTIGEAKSGQGALFTLLKKNAPVFLEQLRNTESQTEALDLMLAAMGKLEDPTLRAALAAAAFGRAGQQMTLITENGAKGLAEARQEAHDLGMVLSESAAKDAEQYVDAMARLKGSLKGVQAGLLSRLIPGITKAVDAMREFWVANQEVISQGFHKALELARRAFEAIPWGTIISGARRVYEALRPLAEDIARTIQANWPAISRTIKTVLKRVVQATLVSIDLLKALWAGLKASVGPVITGLIQGIRSIGQIIMGVVTGDVTLALEGFKGLWRGALKIVGGLWEGFKALVSGVGKAIMKAIIRITPKPLRKMWGPFRTFFRDMWDGMVMGVEWAAGKIKGWIDWLLGPLRAAAREVQDLKFALGMDEGVAIGDLTAMASLQAPTTLPTAFGGVGGAVAASMGQETRSVVEVEFKDAPPGLRVRDTKTSGPGTVKTNVGRRTAGASAI